MPQDQGQRRLSFRAGLCQQHRAAASVWAVPALIEGLESRQLLSLTLISTPAEVLALPNQGFVAEGRIGKIGAATFEGDISPSTAGPFAGNQMIDLTGGNDWVSGSAKGFTLEVRGGVATWTLVGGNRIASTSGVLSGATDLRFRAVTYATSVTYGVESKMILDNMVLAPLNPDGSTGVAQSIEGGVVSTYSSGQSLMDVVAPEILSGDFRLTGQATMVWDALAGRPTNSRISFQISTVKVDRLDGQGTVGFAYESDESLLNLGTFHLGTNTSVSPSNFVASINWGDGTTSAGVISQGDYGPFIVTGQHTYDHDGVYAAVTEVAMPGALGNTTATVLGSLVKVFNRQDELKLEYATSHTLNGSGNVSPNLTLDWSQGTYTLSETGSGDFDFTNNLNHADQWKPEGLTWEEKDGQLFFTLNTSGTLSLSNDSQLTNFTVGGYGLTVDTSSALTVHDSFHNPNESRTDTLQGAYTVHDDKTYNDTYHTYTWHHNEKYNPTVQEHGTRRQSYYADGLVREDAWAWAWDLANQGLPGTFDVSGGIGLDRTFDETGNVSAKIWDRDVQDKNDANLTETGGSGKLSYTQTFVGNGTLSAMIHGNDQNKTYTVTADQGAQQKVTLDLTNGSLTEKFNDAQLDTQIHTDKTGSQLGAFSLNANGTVVWNAVIDTIDKSAHTTTRSDQRMTYEDTNTGDVAEGTLTLTEQGNATTTELRHLTNEKLTRDQDTVTLSDLQLTQRGAMEATGTEVFSATSDVRVIDMIDEVNQEQTVVGDTTTDTAGNWTFTENRGNGNYTTQAATTTTANLDITTTNAPQQIVDTSTTTGNTTSGEQGNTITGDYQDRNSTAHRVTQFNVVTTNGPLTSIDTTTTIKDTDHPDDSGNELEGNYIDGGYIDTTVTNRNVVTTNGPLNIADTTKITDTFTSLGGSGDGIDGTWVENGSTETIQESRHVATVNGSLSDLDTTQISTNKTWAGSSGDDINGSWTDGGRTSTTTTNRHVVSQNKSLTSTDTTQITSTFAELGSNGNDIDGTWIKEGSSSTTQVARHVVTVNGPLTVIDTTTSSSNGTVLGSSGDDLEGTWTEEGSSSTTTTHKNVVTMNETLLSIDTSEVDESEIWLGASGDDIAGDWTDNGTTTTTTDNRDVLTINGPLTTTDTSDIVTVTTESSAGGDDYEGKWNDEGSTSTTTENLHIVTADESLTTTNTSVIVTVTTESDSSGNDINGNWTYTGSTSTTTENLNIVTEDGPLTTTNTSVIVTTDTENSSSGDDIVGNWNDSGSTSTTTKYLHIVTEDGPLTAIDTSVIVTTTTDNSSQGDDIEGTWNDSGSSSTTTRNLHIVTTDGSLTTTDTSVIVTTTTENSSQGDDIEGDWNDSGSTSTTTRNLNIVTENGPLTTTDTSIIVTTDTENSSSGDYIDGDWNDSGSTSTTTMTLNVVTIDGALTTTDTSVIVSTDTENSSSGDYLNGTWSDSGSHSVTTTNRHVVTTEGPLTTIDTSVIAETSDESNANGNSIDGSWGDSGSTSTTIETLNVVTIDGALTITDMSVIVSTDTENSSNGDNLDGNWSDSGSSRTSTKHLHIVTEDGPLTTTDTSVMVSTVTIANGSGNGLSGTWSYSDNSTSDTTTLNVMTTTGLRTSVTTGTSTHTTDTGVSGNDLTGATSTTRSDHASSDVTTVNTYADGSDSQYTVGTSDQATTTTANRLTGVYMTDSSGSGYNAVTETGTRTHTYSGTLQRDTSFATHETGNSLSGSYTLTHSSDDTAALTRSGGADNGFNFTQTTTTAGTTTTTGNKLSGAYSFTGSGTTTVSTQESTTGSAMTANTTRTRTTVSALSGSGNDLDGSYASTDHQTLTETLAESGTTALGSFTLQQTTSDTPTVETEGNTLSGTWTTTATGSEAWDFEQGNTAGADHYDLTGSGTKTYTRTTTLDSRTGEAQVHETGADTYQLHENGQKGTRQYAQTVVGQETYAVTGTENQQNGGSALTTTGGGAYTLTETGTDNGTPLNVSTTGNTNFSQSQTVNAVDGALSLSLNGTSRYSLLEAFNNPSESAHTNAGLNVVSSVGAPVMVGTAPDITGQPTDPDARHLYCFAKGTLVLLADGSSRAIETMEVGMQVLASPEHDPEAKPVACQVLEVFHNAPARIFEVHVRASADGIAEVIRTTAGHPFYVPGKGWVKVGALQVGDRLQTHEGRVLGVEKIVDTGRVEPVFNLHVAQTHTYFVVLPESRQSVLVHNWSWTQTWGLLKAVGGACEVVAGSVMIATGGGAVVGAILIAHGADTAVAGARQVAEDKATRTVTAQGITAGAKLAGASDQTATAIGDAGDAAIGLLGAGFTGGGSSLGTISTSVPTIRLAATTAGTIEIVKDVAVVTVEAKNLLAAGQSLAVFAKASDATGGGGGGGSNEVDSQGFSRNKPTIENGNAKEGWQHIEERHLTGTQPGGDLFATGTTRAELERAAGQIVEKGVRVSDPDKTVQVFQDRIIVNGVRDLVRVVVNSKNNTVITIFPVRQ